MPAASTPYSLEEIKAAADCAAYAEQAMGVKFWREGARAVALCPFHDERDGSFKVDPNRRGYKCWGCGSKGSIIDLVMAHRACDFHEAVKVAADFVGVELNRGSTGSCAAAPATAWGQANLHAGSPPKPATNKKPEKKLAHEERDALLGTDGVLVATHVRREYADVETGERSKKCLWLRDGKWTLGDLDLEDLPLFGAELVGRWPEDAGIILCEGEKAAKAARAAGLRAVGTVTGADYCPSKASLEVLRGRPVVIWRDADDAGLRHANALVERLEGIAEGVRVFVHGMEGVKGADAADHPAIVSGDAHALAGLRQELSEAPVWEAPVSEEPVSGDGVPPGGGGSGGGTRGGTKQPSAGKPSHAVLRDRFLSNGTRYAFGMGKWRSYEDGVWKEEEDDPVKNHVSEIADAAAPEGISPTYNVINSVFNMARIRVAVPSEKWDADTDLLPCRNGVLHIPTRKLLAHSPDYHLTSTTGYDYDPTANAPTWKFFLSEFAEPEKVDFLQEFVAYCLTTDVSQEVAVWLDGLPGGGRSTFTLGTETVLGKRAGTLGLAQLQKSQFALGGIAGKTLLTATEQPGGYTDVTHILNALISGDKMQIERKHKDPYTIYPKAKLMWSMNGLPRVANPKDGIFRRVKVVGIPNPEGRVNDPKIKEKIQTEGAGILNWALEGLDRLLARERFSVPPSIEEDTRTFQTDNDIPAAFVRDVCVRAPEFSEQATPLYQAYRRWCYMSGHQPMALNNMRKEWERLGFKPYAAKGKSRYKGVALNMEALKELGVDED